MDLVYDLEERERPNGLWRISTPDRNDIATASTLAGALKRGAEIAPHGYVRISQKTGRMGVVRLGGPRSIDMG